MSTEQTKQDAEARMQKSLESLRGELSRLRTGRASPALVEHLKVAYYGNPAPLTQVANVGVADARTLTVTPWDKTMVPAIEKAILESGLGLNPVTAGMVIRIPLPPLTEERRREMTRMVRGEGESGKVAVRNVRRDANQHLKNLLKDKKIAEDDEKRAQEEIQKLTDHYIVEVDKLVQAKEKEIMEF
jgi:ribosome recycling factor